MFAVWVLDLPKPSADPRPVSALPDDEVSMTTGKRRWNTRTQPGVPPASTRVQPPPRESTFTGVFSGRVARTRPSGAPCSFSSVERLVNAWSWAPASDARAHKAMARKAEPIFMGES